MPDVVSVDATATDGCKEAGGGQVWHSKFPLRPEDVGTQVRIGGLLYTVKFVYPGGMAAELVPHYGH